MFNDLAKTGTRVFSEDFENRLLLCLIFTSLGVFLFLKYVDILRRNKEARIQRYIFSISGPIYPIEPQLQKDLESIFENNRFKKAIIIAKDKMIEDAKLRYGEAPDIQEEVIETIQKAYTSASEGYRFRLFVTLILSVLAGFYFTFIIELRNYLDNIKNTDSLIKITFATSIVCSFIFLYPLVMLLATRQYNKTLILVAKSLLLTDLRLSEISNQKNETLKEEVFKELKTREIKAVEIRLYTMLYGGFSLLAMQDFFIPRSDFDILKMRYFYWVQTTVLKETHEDLLRTRYDYRLFYQEKNTSLKQITKKLAIIVLGIFVAIIIGVLSSVLLSILF